MRLEHEYTLLAGLNRAKVGRYLSVAAACISSSVVFVLLTLVDIAHRLGVAANLPPVLLSLAGAGSVYAVLYWVFDRYAWKHPLVGRFLNVPDLSGDWHCEGHRISPDHRQDDPWEGKITIIQSWDRIRVRLKTAQSGSNSVAAALVHDLAEGYRLMYHYENEPNIQEMDLKGHRGFAELTFTPDCRTADGEYFNGHGRYTFGTMHLTKEGR